MKYSKYMIDVSDCMSVYFSSGLRSPDAHTGASICKADSNKLDKDEKIMPDHQCLSHSYTVLQGYDKQYYDPSSHIIVYSKMDLNHLEQYVVKYNDLHYKIQFAYYIDGCIQGHGERSQDRYRVILGDQIDIMKKE
jgi:hypothetical protein